MNKKYVIGSYVLGKDIHRTRKNLNMTQQEFADFLNCSKRTIQEWERNKKPIKGIIVTLLDIIQRNPDIVEKLTLKPNDLKVRLYYMYENIVCTVIDVDEISRKVKIKNYIDNALFRAFGINNEPTFEEYEEFLESRCFPKERDKIKLELKKLNIPFYDPFMIIEKTEGRMAEDKFWIKIER
ncbi:MAG: helix-turn-helix domain-containing protein [Erysipelotrichaceae bacterium]|nr:helix-turn-helix domain-containing protein [Erysipelotrichaceae bacterium]